MRKKLIELLKKRAKNKAFWVALVAAILLLAQTIAELFGFAVDLSGFGQKFNDLINAVFGVLVVMGIVANPTTPGIGDNETNGLR